MLNIEWNTTMQLNDDVMVIIATSLVMNSNHWTVDVMIPILQFYLEVMNVFG